MLGLLGLALLTYGLTRFALVDDRADDLRSIGASAWLTLGTLPFVFAFSLFAAYELAFMRIGLQADDHTGEGTIRAKLALVAGLRWRLGDVWDFAGGWPDQLANARGWKEARCIIDEFRSDRADRQRRAREAAERLVQ